MTTLNTYEALKVPELARWAKISEDDARAHCLMVKEVIHEVAQRFGYTPRIEVGPQTWGKSHDELFAIGARKARKGNGRRGANALRAKYGERIANDIIEKAKAAR